MFELSFAEKKTAKDWLEGVLGPTGFYGLQ